MKVDKIYNMDCIDGMKKIDDESINLVFSDIPFNINIGKRTKSRHNGFKGKSYKDNLSDKKYFDLINSWIKESHRILKYDGTIIVMTGWTNLKDILNSLDVNNFYILNHCIVKYAFGVYTKKRFVTSHYHIIFATKSNKLWTFNKQKKYDEDVWMMNREFKSKELNHPCPTTYEWVKKIILTSSNENDLILDSFMGTGTTSLACIKTNRHFIGFEISEEYCNIANKRLKEIL